MTEFKTVAEIKAANEAAGRHFFSPDTLRFFRSRVLDGVIGGRYFITSERTPTSSGEHYVTGLGPRRYTVRRVSDNGAASIDTVGEFQQYKTAAQARKAAREHARS